MNMQFIAYFLASVCFFAFALTYTIRKHSTRKRKNLVAPEPSGALPFIGHLHLLRGQIPLARVLGAMAEKHGPIYSLRLGGRRALVVSSWEMVKECFTKNDRNFATRPRSALTKYIGFDGVGFALAPYGAYWRDIRKMVNLELFGIQPLQKLKHVWNSEVTFLVQDLHLMCQKNGHLMPKVNLTKWLEHEMCNITIRILAGKRLSSDEGNTQDWKVKEAIKKGLYLSGVFVVSDFVPSLEWMDIGGYLKALQQSAKELDIIVAKWLEEHLQKEDGNEADFIHVMLSTLAEGTNTLGYTRDAIIRATMVNLLLTGTESTTETMIWALSLMLNNPHIQKAAQDELDVCVGRNRWVEESDIKKLEYLQAIVKETLRLYPPGPLAGPHEAIEDCYVGGYYVPKGSRLVVNVWQLQHDPRVWSDPYEFRPERFMVQHAEINYQGQNFEYIPFSSGRRMCPASTFALQVVHLTLARLLQGFDLSPPMGKPVDMSEGLGVALPKVKPLEAVLTPRLSPDLYQNL